MGGVIIVVLIVMWGVLLVPMWLRRHEGDAQLGSVERFSTAMRTLGGRHGAERPVPGRKIVVPGPATQRSAGLLARLAARLQARHDGPATRAAAATAATHAEPSRPVPAGMGSPVGRGASTTAAPAAHGAARRPVAAGAPGAVPLMTASRARLLARRRRVLGVLAALSVLAVSGATLDVLPVWPAVLTALLVVAYLAHLRLEAVRAAQLRARRAARTAAAPGAVPVTRRSPAPWAPAHAHGMAPMAGAAAATGVVAGPGVASAPAVQHDGREEAPAAHEAGGAWEPVPVPLPTYVTAPVVHRPAVRLLDDDLGIEVFTRDDEVEELVTRRAANQ